MLLRATQLGLSVCTCLKYSVLSLPLPTIDANTSYSILLSPMFVPQYSLLSANTSERVSYFIYQGMLALINNSSKIWNIKLSDTTKLLLAMNTELASISNTLYSTPCLYPTDLYT